MIQNHTIKDEGMQTSGQELLISKVYEPMGFRQITGCHQITDLGDLGNINRFDSNAHYTLMFAKLSDLKSYVPEYDEYEVKMLGGYPYYQKYIKYKNKYMELKNNLGK